MRTQSIPISVLLLLVEKVIRRANDLLILLRSLL